MSKKKILLLILIAIIILYIIIYAKLADDVQGTVLSILFFLGFILSILNSVWNKNDFFKPSFIYNSIWFLILSISELKLSLLQNKFSFYTYLAIIGAMVSFNFGTKILKESNIKPFESSKNNLSYTYVFIFFILCILAFLIEIKYIGYIPLFSLKETKYIPFLHYITLSFGIVIYLSYVLYQQNKRKKSSFVILSLSILFLFLLRTRQIFLLPFFSILLYINKFKEISIKKILVMIISFSIFFVLVGNLRFSSSDNNNSKSILGYGRIEKTQNEFLGWFNTYTVISLQNFDTNVKKRNEFDKGINTFEFILDLLLLDKVIDIKKSDQIFYSGLGGDIALATYLNELYKDFGLLWVIFFPVFYGIFCKYLYIIYKKNNTWLGSVIYANGIMMIILSAFSSYFSRSAPFVYLLLTIVFNKINNFKIRIR